MLCNGNCFQASQFRISRQDFTRLACPDSPPPRALHLTASDRPVEKPADIPGMKFSGGQPRIRPAGADTPVVAVLDRRKKKHEKTCMLSDESGPA